MSRDESTAGGESAGDDPTRVRVRGIYTTAVTRLLLDADAEVVQASEPIRERFAADFADVPHDVTVATTGDRQGVGIHGGTDAVTAAADCLSDVARDTFAWADPTPPGAVFDAAVTETLGSGAVLDLGPAEGFLPYDATDAYVDAGDALRVQVRESAPPWGDRRADLGTEVRADRGFATLVRGREGITVDTRDDAAGRELAGMTDLLGVEVDDRLGVALELRLDRDRLVRDFADAVHVRLVAVGPAARPRRLTHETAVCSPRLESDSSRTPSGPIRRV